MRVSNIVIVGVGGVGTRLAREIPMYASRKFPEAAITLIDGDVFEHKNLDRQDFDPTAVGMNKADACAEDIRTRFPSTSVSVHSEYVTRDSVARLVPEGSVVFCAVDNHASRKLLSDHVASMRDGMLISGGNDYDNGNVQVYVRSEGVDLCAPITYLHPEIGDPNDPRHSKNPAEMSCEELAAAGAPQLQFANMKVATEMSCAFWMATEDLLKYSEVYFDLKRGQQRPTMRRVIDDAETDGHDGAGVAQRPGSLRSAV